MVRQVCALGLICCALSPSTTAAMLNGVALLQKLKSSDPTDWTVAAGYIGGVVDTWNNRKEPYYQSRCFSIPAGVTVVDLMPVVEYYLENIPASLTYNASNLVWMTLQARYPGTDCTD